MLRNFWPSTPLDQTTPRASALNEHNPFDAAIPSTPRYEQPPGLHPNRFPHHAAGPEYPQPSPRPAGVAPARLSSGLLTPGSLQTALPTTHLSTVPPDFDLRLPPRSAKERDTSHLDTLPPPSAAGPSYPSPSGPVSEPSAAVSPRDAPMSSTSNAASAPLINEQVVPPVGIGVGPPPISGKTRSTSAPKGQLTVSIIGARNLVGTNANSRPYAVVSFDKNEFVGREPMNAPALSHASNESMMLPPRPAFGGCYDPQWNDEVTFDVTYEGPKVFISVYDRQAQDEGFIGMRDITPVLSEHRTSEHWYRLIGRDANLQGTCALEPVGDSGSGSGCTRGDIRVRLRYERRSQRKLTPRDFEYLKLIGRGTFGRVFQVRKKDTRRIYAMKVLSKREIALKKEVVHTMGERKILEKSLDCPFLVGLKFSFQSERELYFVTDYKSGGELFWHLQREGRFLEERAKFYIAELVLALEHLHNYNIVYRDLKPENILLDAMGHVALCDFGLSKPDVGKDQLTSTFCGTTEYLAPEVLLDDAGYSKLVDFWALGVLLFEMCCGWSPFHAEDTQQMYRNICFGKIKFPRGAIGDDGKQLVKGLLNRNPKHRLGSENDAEDLKRHPFFAQIDWNLLANKKIPPPFKPLVESEDSVANFDPEFTGTDLRFVVQKEDNGVGLAKDAQVGNDAPGGNEDDDGILSSSVQHQFSGFSYSGKEDMGTSWGGRSRRGSLASLNSPLPSFRAQHMPRMDADEPMY